MNIHGFTKTTLLDYPGMVAATIFTGNCNFRCPFCHNYELVLNPDVFPAEDPEVLRELQARRQRTERHRHRLLRAEAPLHDPPPRVPPDHELALRRLKPAVRVQVSPDLDHKAVGRRREQLHPDVEPIRRLRREVI